jgi:hypothetical protein
VKIELSFTATAIATGLVHPGDAPPKFHAEVIPGDGRTLIAPLIVGLAIVPLIGSVSVVPVRPIFGTDMSQEVIIEEVILVARGIYVQVLVHWHLELDDEPGWILLAEVPMRPPIGVLAADIAINAQPSGAAPGIPLTATNPMDLAQ